MDPTPRHIPRHIPRRVTAPAGADEVAAAFLARHRAGLLLTRAALLLAARGHRPDASHPLTGHEPPTDGPLCVICAIAAAITDVVGEPGDPVDAWHSRMDSYQSAAQVAQDLARANLAHRACVLGAAPCPTGDHATHVRTALADLAQSVSRGSPNTPDTPDRKAAL